MDLLVKAIRDDPFAFLPEPSLAALNCFRLGYSMEGQPHDWKVEAVVPGCS
jgi:hypothetical protein